MLLDFTRSILMYSCLRGYVGTVNGLLMSIRRLGKYLLELSDEVVLDNSHYIYVYIYIMYVLRIFQVFIGKLISKNVCFLKFQTFCVIHRNKIIT